MSLFWLLASSVAVLSGPAHDLTARFSDDATESMTGVFLQVNTLACDGSDPTATSFAATRLLMRSFVMSNGGVTSGLFVLSAEVLYGDSDMIEVFDVDGRKMALPSEFAFDQLPAGIMVSARSTGRVILRLTHESAFTTIGAPENTDEVLIRVGPFPGLAGHALTQYPFFEFPCAINQNRTVAVALDPMRHGERLGLAYDVYIVGHKSPDGWTADPVLTDLTGCFETAIVNGTTIQQNTTLAWGANLVGDAGVGLGVPYDAVLDFDQNGRLDPGDLIDHLSQDEAGFYVLKDTTRKGPLVSNSFEFDNSALFYTEGFDGGSTRSMRSRGLVVYPDPLPEGELPLVTFSHGNTGIQNSYLGYRYLQELLASHGFITASFDMFPAHVSLGIRWRGWLTNKNTERLILQTQLLDHNGNPYPPMGGGIIDDKVDGDRIVTSGHSRGGEGVIVQYNQVAFPDIPGIRPPNGTLDGYDADSFLGINAIAEVNFLTADEGSTPRDRNFLLYYGGSDADVCGCVSGATPTFHYGRADGNKMMSYLYGAGHGYYNQLWSCVCEGPLQLTRNQVERCSKGYLLPFCMMVTYGNVPAKDFFTRSPNVFRPIGCETIPPEQVMVNLYRDAIAAGNFVIDDYETNFGTGRNSSGQDVTFTVLDLVERLFEDTNPAGGWGSGEIDGGFWWETRGCIFNWNGVVFEYVQTIAPEERDLSDDRYLSFITCQQADHADTTGLAGDRDITVSLVDGDGVKSSINTLSYGGIDEPYLRSGGWGSAFKTYRLRIADFEADGSGIDLKNVVSMKVEVGSDFGSVRGRLGFDDFEIIRK